MIFPVNCSVIEPIYPLAAPVNNLLILLISFGKSRITLEALVTVLKKFSRCASAISKKLFLQGSARVTAVPVLVVNCPPLSGLGSTN